MKSSGRRSKKRARCSNPRKISSIRNARVRNWKTLHSVNGGQFTTRCPIVQRTQRVAGGGAQRSDLAGRLHFIRAQRTRDRFRSTRRASLRLPMRRKNNDTTPNTDLCTATQPDGRFQRCIRFHGHDGPHQTFVAQWGEGDSVSHRRQPRTLNVDKQICTGNRNRRPAWRAPDTLAV